jgi:sulfur carrier protein
VTLIVSNIFKEYPEGISLAALIEKEQLEAPQYATISVNDEFVESGTFDKTILKEGDNIEFLYFIGGGHR